MMLISAMKNLRFVLYNDLVLFDEKSLISKLNYHSKEEFLEHFHGDDNFKELQKKLRFKRAGFIGSISDDHFRTPNVTLFYCDSNPSFPIDPWVVHTDNGIKYTFDVTRTMFCKGNIKEKLRLAKMDCRDEIVVDLFAGIGYFSLIFAVHCRAKHVYCCEWNPAALMALQRNIKLNNVEDRMTICPGDNHHVCPTGIAQRVQMGLIPTSLKSLDVACRALNVAEIGGKQLTLHVHENLSYYLQIKSNPLIGKQEVIKNERQIWAQNIREQVETILKTIISNHTFSIEIGEIIKIKQYAPYIDHLVVDIHVSKESAAENKNHQ